MKNRHLMNVFGDIDEKYIEEAAPREKKNAVKLWVKIGAAAACLCLLAGGAYAVARLMRPESVPPAVLAEDEKRGEGYTVISGEDEKKAQEVPEDGDAEAKPAEEDGKEEAKKEEIAEDKKEYGKRDETPDAQSTDGQGVLSADEEITDGESVSPDIGEIEPPEPTYTFDADAAATASDSGFVVVNRKQLTDRLYDALEKAGDGDTVTVSARAGLDSLFISNGRTLSEYQSDSEDERFLPEKLMQLLKEGEDLKYGEALVTTGTPDGIKWYKGLYEERVAFYGEELLSKYIADGEFLRERLEADIKEAEAAHAARDAYDEAKDAYYTQLASSYGGEYAGSGRIILSMTKSEFAAFSPEDISYWTFDLDAPIPGGSMDAVHY